MMLIHLKLKTTVNAPARTVWRVLAHEFDDIDRWSFGTNKSIALEGIIVLISAMVGGRLWDTTEKEFTFYDESSMRFGYRMANLP